MNVIKIKQHAWIIVVLLILLFQSCKTGTKVPVKTKTEIPEKSDKMETVYPTEPGTCVIQGYLNYIFPVDTTSQEEPCKSFPCKATAIITKSRSCGFGVQKAPQAGDTIVLKFIHSIAKSEDFKKVYPAKIVLPGLKVEQLFEAQVKTKIIPGDLIVYEIDDYELLR